MDAVLLAAAAFIAAQSPHPLSPAVVFSIVGCVIAATIVGTIPLLVRYEREKNETLDERQHALEALSRTITASAEQIGIAANGLHTVAELAQKNLRHAEQLPHKLQDKMAEFQSALANAEMTEKEELEKELEALRSSETERLETISGKIAKSTADLTRLEGTAQKNLAAAQDAMAKLDEKLRATLAAFDARLATLEKSASRPMPVPAASPVVAERESARAVVASDSTTASASSAAVEPPDKTPSSPAPKAPRPPRREESPAEKSPVTSPVQQVEIKELPPVKLQKIVPVAPGTRPPSQIHTDDSAPPLNASPAPLPAAVAAPAGGTNPPRKRSEKKSGDTAPAIAVKESSASEHPTLTLELETAVASRPPLPSAAAADDSDFTQVSPDEAAPSAAVAADGATRLLVTAYIGIGNRLFIRGSGPGLSWEKGVPLQFVSIGKWRWETADATAPVNFKLYKNDELECTVLGAQSLAAGHQQELTATF